MGKVKKFIVNLDLYIATALVFLILFDVAIQVISRMMPTAAVSWTVEIGEFLLACLIWFGMSAGVTRGSHICFDILIRKRSDGVKKVMGIISNVIFMAYTIMLAYLAYELIGFYISIDSRKGILQLPQAFTRSPIFIGTALASIKLLFNIIGIMTGKIKAFPVEEDALPVSDS